MKIFTTLVFAVVIVALGMIGFAYSGLYDVGANSPHGGFTNWLLSTTSHASIKRHSKRIEVPQLDSEVLKLAGANDFAAMCAGCHGAPGQGPDAAGQGLNPPAPSLAESSAHMSTAELFWVTKNGIKMTGMPAWGASHDDAALWPVVTFLTALPNMDADEYQALLANAKGIGHHADDGQSDESHSHSNDQQGEMEPDHDTTDEAGSHDGDVQKDESDEHDHSTHPHD